MFTIRAGCDSEHLSKAFPCQGYDSGEPLHTVDFKKRERFLKDG